MTIGAAIRRGLFWAHDKYRENSRLRHALDEINTVNQQRSARTTAIRDKRLGQILAHATTTCPYYADFAHATSLQDFPVIDKLTIIENEQALSSSLFAGMKLHKQHTSGSTGIPFTVRQDPEKRLRVIAEIKAMNEIAHYPSHERMLYVAAGVKAGDLTWIQQFY